MIDRRDLRPTKEIAMQGSDVPAVEVEMGIRRPPPEVFRAFVDPAVTTRFWFSKSSGALTEGETVTWEWEKYGATAEVRVREIREPERILIDWGDGEAFSSVEFRFNPWGEAATHMQVLETGIDVDPEQAVARIADSTGGFTMVLCAAKALLEHDIELRAVQDRNPDNVEL
jgi:uncharacterized protein YndB with AHSA1/START domain